MTTDVPGRIIVNSYNGSTLYVLKTQKKCVEPIHITTLLHLHIFIFPHFHISKQLSHITPPYVFMIFFSCRSIEHVIHIPTTIVTGLVFGGPKLDTLYVTTATQGVQAYQGDIVTETKTAKYAGKIYEVVGWEYNGAPSEQLDLDG